MSRRLLAIGDWERHAAQAQYCVAKLAQQYGVSVRTVHRHFVTHFKQRPHHWLHQQRMKRAHTLLMQGSSVKETAAALGYRHASHFTKDFSKHNGYAPSQHVSRTLQAADKTQRYNSA